MNASGQTLRVGSFDSLEDLDAWRASFREINLASRRPSPFQTIEYFAVHMAHDELATPGAEPLFLVAFEGERVVGLLPMRRRPEPLFGVPRTRLELLATYDTDRLGVIARAEDEARCADAFAQYLVEHVRGWTMLEFREQDVRSPLQQPSIDERRFYLRRSPSHPNATIELGAGFDAWFASLDNFRTTLRRRVRQLLGAGRLEFVASDDPRGAHAFLDLYLDLERRSWKLEGAAGIGRHATRVAKFHALLGHEQQHRPLFHWLLLDGLPIAGMLSLQFAGVAYQMELAFDRDFRETSPGNLLFVLAVRDAVARGAKAYNLLGNFSYHDQRWNAALTDTSAVQIYRRGSLHHQQAVADEWRRRVFGAGASPRDGEVSAGPHDDAGPVVQRTSDEDRGEAIARAAAVFTTLECDGVSMFRLDGEALASAFSFVAGERSFRPPVSIRPAAG